MRGTGPSRHDRYVIAVLLALSFVLAGGRPSCAGSYDPVLVVGQAITTGATAPTAVSLTGSWSYDDILQVSFPLNIVVSQGNTFARYPVGSSSAISGTFSGLADGLTAQEISSFEAAGSADPQAMLVRLTTHNVTLALPPIFAAGPLKVMLYVNLTREGILMSNVAESTVEVGP